MTPNNNLSVLPWYDSIEKQNARKWWVYGRVYPLFTPAGYILPFQLIVPHIGTPTISSVVLFDGRTGEEIGEYGTDFTTQGLTVKQLTDYDVVVFPGSGAIFGSMANGRYYLSMTVNGITYYSEVFTVVNDIAPYLEIEWWNVEDFVMDAGTIVYTEPTFKNRMFIQADIAKPEYLFEEEGESRDGYFFPVKQISEKRYRFSFFASEYLLDVMRFIRMADYVKIHKNGQTYSADTFLITPEWEAEGDVAAVSVEFDTDTVAKKIPFITEGIIPPTPGEHYLTVSPSAITFLAAGQTVAISIVSDMSWVISLPSWLSANIMTGTGNATVQLTAQANSRTSVNTGTVIVSGEGITRNVSVMQPTQGASYLSVSPMSIDFNSGGQTVTVSVSSNIPWSLVVPSWVTASQLSGSGNASITLTAPANTTGSARAEVYAVFAGSGVSNVNITLNQEAQIVPAISINRPTFSTNYKERTFYFQITCNGAWECSGSTAAWLTCNSIGNGNGTATIHLDKNTTASSRTGTLTFRMIDYPSVTCTSVLTQSAYEPTITYQLELEQGDEQFSFGADGEEVFTPLVYGVTLTDGVVTSRQSLNSSALSFAASGDAVATRNGLTFSASNLGTTVTSQTHQIWTFTWNAHPTATATLDLYQNANTRTVNNVSQSATFPNIPSVLLWTGSGTNEALVNGDTMTLNPTLHFVRVENVTYSSGIQRDETVIDANVTGNVVVDGMGLSVSGSGNAWTVQYGNNSASSTRNGVVTISARVPNSQSWVTTTRNVSQAGANIPVPSSVSVYIYSLGHSEVFYLKTIVSGGYVWTKNIGGVDVSIFMPENAGINDPVYADTSMTEEVGYIEMITY